MSSAFIPLTFIEPDGSAVLFIRKTKTDTKLPVHWSIVVCMLIDRTRLLITLKPLNRTVIYHEILIWCWYFWNFHNVITALELHGGHKGLLLPLSCLALVPLKKVSHVGLLWDFSMECPLQKKKASPFKEEMAGLSLRKWKPIEHMFSLSCIISAVRYIILDTKKLPISIKSLLYYLTTLQSYGDDFAETLRALDTIASVSAYLIQFGLPTSDCTSYLLRPSIYPWLVRHNVSAPSWVKWVPTLKWCLFCHY